MPRRSILSAAEREGLLAFPDTEEELIRHYTFSEPDMSAIRQRRGNHNRIGFAVQLCYLRYPGFGLPTDAVPPMPLLAIINDSCTLIRIPGRRTHNGRKHGASTWRTSSSGWA